MNNKRPIATNGVVSKTVDALKTPSALSPVKTVPVLKSPTIANKVLNGHSRSNNLCLSQRKLNTSATAATVNENNGKMNGDVCGKHRKTSTLSLSSTATPSTVITPKPPASKINGTINGNVDSMSNSKIECNISNPISCNGNSDCTTSVPIDQLTAGVVVLTNSSEQAHVDVTNAICLEQTETSNICVELTPAVEEVVAECPNPSESVNCTSVDTSTLNSVVTKSPPTPVPDVISTHTTTVDTIDTNTKCKPTSELLDTVAVNVSTVEEPVEMLKSTLLPKTRQQIPMPQAHPSTTSTKTATTVTLPPPPKPTTPTPTSTIATTTPTTITATSQTDSSQTIIGAKSTLWAKSTLTPPGGSGGGSTMVFDFRDKKSVKANIAIQPTPFGSKPIPKSIAKQINGGGVASSADDDEEDEDDFNYCGTMEMPPPCHIRFEGENVCDGKSSLLVNRNKNVSCFFCEKFNIKNISSFYLGFIQILAPKPYRVFSLKSKNKTLKRKKSFVDKTNFKR